MTAQPRTYWTVEAYLEMERTSEVKHEFHNGEIFAMAGAKPNHNRICANIGGTFFVQLHGKGCERFTSDQKIKVEATGLYAYPDFSIVCGTPKFEDRNGLQTLTNPTLLVEVLSDSTEGYNRGAKMDDYFQIASLQEYVLIWQDEPKMQRYLRQPNGEWLFAEALGEQGVLTLPSVNCTLKAGEVYEFVKFDPRPVRRVDKSASE